MSEAPERIMAYGEINTKWGVQFKCQPMPMQGMPSFPLTEYVRADCIEELEAKLAAERERCAKVADHLENILDALGFLTGGDWELEGWGISQEEGAEIRKDLAAIRKGDTP